MTALPAARAATTPLVGIAAGKFHGPATSTTPSGSAAMPSAASSSSSLVHAAAHMAKSMASDTSGSPSRTVLPVSWAITASVRPRSAAITSATFARARRRSAVDVAAQRAAPSCARRTTSSMPSVVVISGGSSAGRSACEVLADPFPVGGLGEVRVGLVGERRVGVEAASLVAPVLGAPGLTGHGRHGGDGGLEASPLGVPRRRVGCDREQRAEEVLRGGVLVEPAGEVGDAGGEVLVGDHRCVEEQFARVRPGRTRLGRRHAFEHLDADRVFEPAAVALAECPGHVEQVVAADADDQAAVFCRVEEAREQCLEAGVDLRLGGVGRGDPSAELGIDVLHRQVGTLDEAHLHGRAAGAMARGDPRQQIVDDVVGVGQVRLDDDPRRKLGEPRLVEHGTEGGDGEVEVAVLLHVQVDEHRRPRAGGDVVDGLQAGRDARHLVVEGEHVEVGAQRRDLHRDVVDVGPAHPIAQRVEPCRGLVVAEDGLAEQVDVDGEAVGLPVADMASERRVRGGDDHAARLGADAPPDDRRHRPGCRRRRQRGEPQCRSVRCRQRGREPGADEVAELGHRASWIGRAQHLVGEGEQQLAPAVVAEQAAEAIGAPAFARRRLGAGDVQQPLCPQDRNSNAFVVGHASIEPVRSRGRRWPCCAWSVTWSRTSSCDSPARRHGVPIRRP